MERILFLGEAPIPLSIKDRVHAGLSTNWKEVFVIQVRLRNDFSTDACDAVQVFSETIFYREFQTIAERKNCIKNKREDFVIASLLRVFAFYLLSYICMNKISRLVDWNIMNNDFVSRLTEL